MAHPLGALYDTPHGVANAIILPTVMEYNGPATGEKYRDIAKFMGVEGTDTMTEEEYRAAAVGAVTKLGQDVGIPANLAYDHFFLCVRVCVCLASVHRQACFTGVASPLVFTTETTGSNHFTSRDPNVPTKKTQNEMKNNLLVNKNMVYSNSNYMSILIHS